MVAIGARAGVVLMKPGPGFARPRAHQAGNDLPADSGVWAPEQDTPGPSPSSPGYVIAGTAGGGNDAFWGPDPRQPQIAPWPRSQWRPGEGQAGAEDAAPGARQSYWRGALQGFNDKLTVKDRHAAWFTGYQRQGTDFTPASSPPNTYNNPLQEPPQARLRTINRTVSYQKGTDTSRNQDDLSRPYPLAQGTRGFIGEQGSGYSPVYGGVPGLYQPYGTRGGVPYPIVDPTGGNGGREVVWAGPPHGLHSLTFPDTADTLKRYVVLPQMRPVRVDRPSNSPQAGQAYSQTVQHQGGPPRAGRLAQRPVHHSGRGWAGAQTAP